MIIPKKFGFKIANAAGADKLIALLAGNLDTDGFDVTQNGTTPFAVTAVTKHCHDVTALNAYGVNVDGVADDGTILTSVTCTALNSQHKIRHFREFLKYNPMVLKKLTIEASNKDVFENSLFIRQDSPVHGTAPQEYPLSVYFNLMQVQENKVDIVFDNVPLGDETILWMNIPDNRTVTFRMELAYLNPWTNQVLQ